VNRPPCRVGELQLPGLVPGLALSIGAPLATILVARLLFDRAHVFILVFWMAVGLAGHWFVTKRTGAIRDGATRQQWTVWVMAIGMPCLLPAFLSGGRVFFLLPAFAGWMLFFAAISSGVAMLLSEWTVQRSERAGIAAGMACSAVGGASYLTFMASMDDASVMIFWLFIAPAFPVGGLLLHVERRRRLEAATRARASTQQAIQREAALADRIGALRRAQGLPEMPPEPERGPPSAG